VMVRARRIVYDVKKKETREEEFDFTPPPPLPKTYAIYRTLRLRTGKEIRTQHQFVGELTDDEIKELKEKGWKVEETPV